MDPLCSIVDPGYIGAQVRHHDTIVEFHSRLVGYSKCSLIYGSRESCAQQTSGSSSADTRVSQIVTVLPPMQSNDSRAIKEEVLKYGTHHNEQRQAESIAYTSSYAGERQSSRFGSGPGLCELDQILADKRTAELGHVSDHFADSSAPEEEADRLCKTPHYLRFPLLLAKPPFMLRIGIATGTRPIRPSNN